METVTRKMDLRDCCPVAGVLDGVIHSRDGALTIGWELLLPEQTSVTGRGYDDMVRTFASAFRSLPEWTVMHRQDRFTRRRWHGAEGGTFLSRSFARHFEGRGYLEHRSFIFFTFNPSASGKAGVFKSFGSTAPFGMRRRAPRPADLEGRLEEFTSKAADFISIIAGAGIQSRRLTTADLEGTGADGGLMQGYLMLGSQGPMVDDIWRDRRGTCVQTCGKRLLAWSFSSSDDLPGEVDTSLPADTLSGDRGEVRLSFASPLGVALDCEHVLNTYTVHIPQQEVLTVLDHKHRNMTVFSERSAENTVNAEDIGEFIDMIHRDSRMCVYTHANILAWDVPERELQLRGMVSTALSRMGVTAKMNSYDTPVLYWAGLPGAEMELGGDNWRLGELYESLCMSTYESFQRGIEGGFLRLCDRQRHIPVAFDTLDVAYSRKLIENYNAFILGPSGSGKSFFTNWYVRSCYERGAHVFIIDKGDSYETQCAIVREESSGSDGVYYTWSAEHPFSFNPFAGWRSWESEEDNEGMNFVLTVLRMLWTPEGGWNEVNGPILYQIVRDFLDSVSGWDHDPVFDDFYAFQGKQILPRITGRNKRLKAYVVGHDKVSTDDFDIADFDKALSPFGRKGRFSFLLNNPSPADLFTSRFVVFEVDKLAEQKEIYPVCTFCILNAFERKMRQNRTDFKLMFIEEAWSAIATPQTGAYIKNLWKTARKYHTQAAVVTQQLSDILSSDIVQDAILGNSPIKVLLDQSSNAASFTEMVRCFGLRERDSSLVQSVGKGLDPRYGREVFISLGGRLSGVFNLEVSPEERWAYESDKAVKQPLLDLARSTGSMTGAIREKTAIGKI